MIADVTHDLNEQISQLMQCKPLSEQQVFLPFPFNSFDLHHSQTITPIFSSFLLPFTFSPILSLGRIQLQTVFNFAI